MSDFDEEAERERLREQFERDRKKREATERMSELLLQGATMTESHCETCGDPIFRYDGQEFCPTCQGSAGENADDGASDDATPETADPSAEEPVESTTDATSEETTETTTEPATNATAETSTDPSVGSTDARPGKGDEAAAKDDRSSAASERDQRVDVPALGPEQDRSTSREAGDLTDARDSLVATLSSFARQAEATDDPRRAQDALEATREAAEALAALDRLR